MPDQKPSDKLWDEIARLLGDDVDCVAYTEEELASFAEGRMRRGAARMLERHLGICPTCSAVVGALREQVAEYEADDVRATLAARGRPAVGPTRTSAPSSPDVAVLGPSPRFRWRWALVTVSTAAMLLVVIWQWRPSRPGETAHVAPVRPAKIAEKPSPGRPAPMVGPTARLATESLPAPRGKGRGGIYAHPSLQRRLAAAASPAPLRVPSTGTPGRANAEASRPARSKPSGLVRPSRMLAAGAPGGNEVGGLPELVLLAPDISRLSRSGNVNEIGALPRLGFLEESVVFDVEAELDMEAHPDLVNELSEDDLRAGTAATALGERLFVSPENAAEERPAAEPLPSETEAKP